MTSVWRTAVVVLVTLVLQVELFSDTRIFGVMPELLLGATVAAGWAGGPERGAIVGFTCGILYDLYLPTPLALSALTYVLVGFAIGLVSAAIAYTGEYLMRRLITLGGIAVGVTLFVLIGELLGQSSLYTDRFFTILIVATLYTTLLMPLLHRGMHWAFHAESDLARPPQRLHVME